MTLTKDKPSAQAGGKQRATWLSKDMSAPTSIAVVVCAIVIICATVVVAVLKLSSSPSKTSATAGASLTAVVRYLGVYEPGAPRSYAGVEQFAHAVGRQPNLVSYYSGWGEKFQTAFAEADQPWRHHDCASRSDQLSIANIAAGMYDSYLTTFADEVAVFKHPVVISFGHEMNGYWYSWGYSHTPPATFVAAWRHIVNLFRQQGADNVKWLWQVNSLSSRTGPPHDWWPGSQYVTWVGVSGYFYVPGDTFDNIFNPVVTAVRQFTKAPVLIRRDWRGPTGRARTRHKGHICRSSPATLSWARLVRPA